MTINGDHNDVVPEQQYWDSQYKAKATGWDLGAVSPPLKNYIDQLTNKDIKILIPGAGNAYEAGYLLQKGFTNITIVDIAPTVVEKLKTQFELRAEIKIIHTDFFNHQEKYDLIIEQTFFCALAPSLRQRYVAKMHELLCDNGKLVGLLFNREFENSPPFGGNTAEYEKLFFGAFIFNTIEPCYNSVPPRSGSELFINFTKNSTAIVLLYRFKGITCNGCMHTVTEKLKDIKGVKNVSINTSFDEVLIVSEHEIEPDTLQQNVSFDEKYSIEKMN